MNRIATRPDLPWSVQDLPSADVDVVRVTDQRGLRPARGLLDEQRSQVGRLLGLDLTDAQPRAYASPERLVDRPGAALLLGRVDGLAVGVVAVVPLDGVPGTVELKRMYVTRAARGLGLGRLLATTALDVAAELGHTQVVLETHPRLMGPALELYRSLGFAPCEPFPGCGRDDTVFLGRPVGPSTPARGGSPMSAVPRTAHPVRLRSRVTSWLLSATEDLVEGQQGTARQELLARARGVVLEVGAGNGPTLRHLPSTVERVVAVEPNAAFHERLERAADRAGVDLEVLPVDASDLPLADASVDTVVCSWVLCTVDDPSAVLSELRRVLAPSGRLLFVEHVAAPRRSVVGRVQQLVRRPWRWVFEGCDVRRHTVATLRTAGWVVEVEHSTLRTAFVPLRPQVLGTARPREGSAH